MNHRVEIDGAAFRHNLDSFRKLCPDSQFLAVVKSNAYGHGLEHTIELLSGRVDSFGVNSIQEAFRIRERDQKTPILVMGQNDEKDYVELKNIRAGGITFVLSSIDEIAFLKERAPGVPFHLKVDTGMGRLGFNGKQLQKVLDYLSENSSLPWTGLMSHFANVEDVTDQSYAQKQLDLFQSILSEAHRAAGKRSLIRHIAASASAMLLPESRMDMIRVGISLYGLWPSEKTRISLQADSGNGSVISLRPVMRWVTRVVHLNFVNAGSNIGYGCTAQVNMNSTIAVLPVGYYEGYDRSLSNRSHVLIRGRRAPLLGRVCMNMITVDVTHIEGIKVGDEAVLIGSSGDEEITADALAEMANTINYEIVSRIQSDIPRVVV